MFGLYHGLVYLPVLLSLIGPKPYASAHLKYKPESGGHEQQAAEPLRPAHNFSEQDLKDPTDDLSATLQDIISYEENFGSEITGHNNRHNGTVASNEINIHKSENGSRILSNSKNNHFYKLKGENGLTFSNPRESGEKY